MKQRLACLLLVFAASPQSIHGLETVKFRHRGDETSISGKEVVTAEDGGVLLLAADGTLWAIEPGDLVSRSRDERAFRPLTRDALSKQLLSELPADFEVFSTKRYMICYNTSREYAAWCGALFERLHAAFINFWSQRGMKIREPEFPLVAIVFGDRTAYAAYSEPELGESASTIVGYYSFRSNRVTMYDLTGVESLRSPGNRRGSRDQINQMLAQPEAEQLVATIVHEATHQIAFNCGLQTRYADIPLWVSEGLAVYFETPDLDSAAGWRTIGAVNDSRLERFHQYLPKRPSTSLKSLISDDKRVRESRTSLDAYAEAWALTYYLVRQHSKQYVAYLKLLSEKQPLIWDAPDTRLKEFQNAFGDLGQLDTDFLRSIQRAR